MNHYFIERTINGKIIVIWIRVSDVFSWKGIIYVCLCEIHSFPIFKYISDEIADDVNKVDFVYIM